MKYITNKHEWNEEDEGGNGDANKGSEAELGDKINNALAKSHL